MTRTEENPPLIRQIDNMKKRSELERLAVYEKHEHPAIAPTKPKENKKPKQEKEQSK